MILSRLFLNTQLFFYSKNDDYRNCDNQLILELKKEIKFLNFIFFVKQTTSLNPNPNLILGLGKLSDLLASWRFCRYRSWNRRLVVILDKIVIVMDNLR